MSIPEPIIIVLILFIILPILLMLLSSKVQGKEKVVWSLIVLLSSWIGLYYFPRLSYS